MTNSPQNVFAHWDFLLIQLDNKYTRQVHQCAAGFMLKLQVRNRIKKLWFHVHFYVQKATERFKLRLFTLTNCSILKFTGNNTIHPLFPGNRTPSPKFLTNYETPISLPALELATLICFPR